MALVVVPAFVAAISAQADPILTVTNGNFAQYSSTTNAPGSTANGGDQFSLINPTGWSSSGSNPNLTQNLIFITNAAGVNNNNLYLQVYNTQSSTGQTAPFPGPPPGGNFVEADGNPDYESSFSYLLTGLTPGQQYQLSFFQTAGEQQGFGTNGQSTTNQWIVGLGTAGFNITYTNGGALGHYALADASGSVAVSPLMTVPDGTYAPWQQVTVNLTADSTSDLLTFLAWGNSGSTANVPPIAFLDIAGNGAVVGAPEPASLSLMVIGMSGFGAYRLRRRRSKPTTV